MVRGLVDAILLFCLPFVVYAAYLAIRRRISSRFPAWGREPVLRLVIAGLALAVAGTLLGGVFGHRSTGGYNPAHLERGVLVPGRLD